MQINNISIHSIPFKAHYINVDVGASTINGSLKLCAIDENDNIIAKERTTVFDEGESCSEDKFEQNLAKKIAFFEYLNKEKIEKADPKGEMQLTVCYPGAKVKRDTYTGFTLSNFFYDNTRRHRFERPINPVNIDTYLKHMGINVTQSRHANDMAGAGACLLKQLKDNHPELLQKGEEMIYMYPGGGLGTGIIMVDDDNIKIKPTEIQHIAKNHTEKDSLETEVRAFSLRKNYADGLDLDIEERAKLGENTMVVDNYEVTKSILPYITEEEHNKASKYAIDKYMDSFAQLIATRVCESKLRTVIITGPIANSLKNSVNANPEFEDIEKGPNDDKFSAHLKKKIQEHMTPVGLSLLGNPDDLNIVFLKIKDNTEGAQLLQKGKEVGEPTAWYNIYD